MMMKYLIKLQVILMIKIIKGDLLKAKEDIICHQCNTDGIFGGGLAYSIKQLYPLCEKTNNGICKY